MADSWKGRIRLQILKVDSPKSIWAKEVPGEGMSEEAQKFLNLSQSMNEYFNNDETYKEPVSHPKKGQVCIGRRMHDKRWYRVQVREPPMNVKGQAASCFLLDYAVLEMIPARWLYQSQPLFFQAPLQAKKYRLAGLCPLTLITSIEDFKTTKQPCKRWDPSTTTFLKKLFNGTINPEAEIMRTDHTGTIHVKMYIIMNDDHVCVNNLLVDNEYGIYTDSKHLGSSDEEAPSEPPLGKNVMDLVDEQQAPRRTPTMGHQTQHPQMDSPLDGPIPVVFSQAGRGIPLFPGRSPSPGVKHRVLKPPSLLGRGIPAAAFNTGSSSHSAESEDSRLKRPLNVLCRGMHLQRALETGPGVGQSRSAGSVRTDIVAGRGAGKCFNPLQPLPSVGCTVSSQGAVQGDPPRMGCKGQGRGMPAFLAMIASKGVAPPCEGTPQSVQPSPATQTEPGPPDTCGSSVMNGSVDADCLNAMSKHLKDLLKVSEGPPGKESTESSIIKANASPTSERGLMVKALAGEKTGKSASSPSPSGLLRGNSKGSPGAGSGPIPLPAVFTGSSQSTDMEPKLLARLPKCVTQSTNKSNDKIKGVSFSESEEILKPRPETSTSPKPVPLKPILKNSSGDEDSLALHQVQVEASDSSSDEEVSLKGVNKSNLDASQFLMDVLCPGAKTLQRVEELYVHGTTGSSFDQGVLVDGERVPAHVTSVTHLPFAEPIKQVMLGCEIKQTWLQAYGWPAVWRGRDVIGIAGTFRDKCPRGGKTYTYLLPLVTQLQHSDTYAGVPKGCGPLAIVLCSSWRRAQTVYDQTRCLLGNMIDLRLNVIFGGGREDAQEIQLINGCEMLVATPHSLLRMVHKDIVELKRLCHLILDDGDNLIEEFPTEVGEIMQTYENSLLNCPLRSAPRQLIVMGTHWTKGMSNLLQSQMTDPVVIIESKVEAAYYAKVDKVVHMVYADQRVSKLIGLLESTANKRTAIFTTSVREAVNVYELLRSHSQYTLLCHEDMVSMSVEAVHSEWTNVHSEHSQPIIVLTDRVLAEMGIHDAEVVIHYDPPSHKSQLGPRLWCLRDHFHLPFSTTEDEKRPLSMMLVTEEWRDYIPLLMTDLRRTNTPAPAALLQFAQGLNMGKEEHKFTELCPIMKAYGNCRSEYRCKGRHTIFKDLDTPGAQLYHQKLPTCGQVTVLVMSVEDAGCYWVRLLEHRDRQKTTELRGSFAKLSIQLNIHFAEWANRILCDDLEVGELCAVEDKQHVFNRAVRLSAPTGYPVEDSKFLVRHVDTGIQEWVPREEIYQLPIQFKTTPFQAVEVYICRVKPTDEDREWTTRATDLVTDMIERRQLEGKIVLTLGNTLWLDPLVERKVLKEVGTITNSLVLHHILLQNDMAIPNPQHIQLLYAACRDRVDLPDILDAGTIPSVGYDMHGLPVSYCTAVLGEVDGLLPTVFLTAIEHPGSFYLQLAESAKRLERFTIDAWEHVSTAAFRPDAQFSIGTLVLALFPFDEFDEEHKNWYRCKIMDMDDGRYDLLYMDTGEREWVAKDDVRPMPSKFANWPFQAIECSLAYISPTSGEWCDDDGGLLWNMTAPDNTPRPLKAQVVEIQEAQVLGITHYKVALFDTGTEFNIDICQELIVKGLAKATNQLMDLEFVSMSQQTGDLVDDPSVNSIPDLCKKLLCSEDKAEQHAIASSIQNIIIVDTKADLCPSGAMGSLCRLLGYVADSDIADLLITWIILLASSNENNQVAVCKDGVQNFCRMLHRDDRSLHKSATWALASLAKEEKCREELLGCGVLRLLLGVLRESDNQEVQLDAAEGLQFLTQALREQDRISVLHTGCVDVLCQLIKTSSNLDLLIKCLAALRTILLNVRNQEDCGKVAISVLCDRLKSPDTIGPLVDAVVMAIVALAQGSRINKEVMLELNMLVELQRLTESENGSMLEATRTSAAMLHDALLYVKRTNEANALSSPQPAMPDGHKPLLDRPLSDMPALVPVPEPVRNVPLSQKQLQSISQSMRPQVLWFQDRRNLILTVKVKNVTDPGCVSLAPESVSFRAIVETIEYTLNLRLYEMIDMNRSEWQVKRGHVLIGLRKVTKGNWPRVTKGKGRVSYITPDFSHFMDDSSSDTDNEVDRDQEKPLAIIERCSTRPPGLPPPAVGHGTSSSLDSNIRPYDDDDDDDQSSFASDDDIWDIDEHEADMRSSFFNL